MQIKMSVGLLAFVVLFCSQLAAQTPQTVVHVLDPVLLEKLENSGYSLNETLGQKTKLSATSGLFKSNSRYQAFANQIGKQIPHDKKTDQLPDQIPAQAGDIPEMVRSLRGFEDKGARSDKDLKAGFKTQKVANNSQYPYAIEQDGDEPRHFDFRWLNSNFSYFKLVAIANRLDRKDITKDSCGEVRFIYRLSYKSQKSKSSLPFFLNVVHEYPKKESCTDFAKSWQMAQMDLNLLKSKALAGLKFRQLEVNFQSLRFTSGYMHDFGGQAMYMQRIFRDVAGKFEPIGLENTPDVFAIRRDPTLLKRFIDYLKKPEVLEQLDLGTIDIDFDPKFLAKLSVSWSTLGRARTANRPYSEIFNENRSLLESIDIAKLKYIKSHDGLVERLNNLTCMGCHQSGGTAGFHMLGHATVEFSHPFNMQEQALSPHALSEVARRTAWTNQTAAGKEPNRFRPHSTYSDATWNTPAGVPTFANLNVGQICFSDTKAFANSPTCGDPAGRAVECRATVTTKGKKNLLGECVLKEPIRSAGHACWMGEISESTNQHPDRNPLTANIFAFEDKWKMSGAIFKDPKPYGCVLPQSGAPLGRMSRKCTLTEENFAVDLKGKIPEEICANQGGQGFDMCAASGDSGACLETKVARSMLDTCHDGRTCREDYICQKFPRYDKISEKDYVRKKNGQLINLSVPSKINGKVIAEAQNRGIGFCVPTYFLFNMRLDGHPSPVTGLPPGEPKYDRTQPLRGYR